MKIIGLTGAAGAGKDTVAQIALEWCEERDISAERVAFADPLKVSAAKALGLGANPDEAPPSTQECVEFCNEIKQPGVRLLVLSRQVPPDVSLEPPHDEVLTAITGREFLQFYGTEAHRDVFDREFWVNATMQPLDERFRELRAPDVVFVADCRFDNEAAAIHERGGEVWEVARPNQAKIEAHVSEAGLPEAAIDAGIRNVGTLDDLRDKVRLICEQKLEGAK